MQPTHPESDHAAGDDLSALAWVQGELRRSLENAHKALRRYVKEAESIGNSDMDAVDPAVLRNARVQLHQGVGALELVGLPVVAQVLRASEAAIQRLIARPKLANAAAVETIEQVSFAVLDYLGRVLGGKRVSPLALFPQYAAAQALAGAERVHPADLWSVDWQWRPLPADAPVTPRVPDDHARGEMEYLTLALMRGADVAAQRRMSELCAELSAGTAGEQSILWQLAAAFFEGQAAGLIAPDLHTKRVGSRLLAMLRSAVRGQPDVSDRLAQDLLFFCVRAQLPEGSAATPRLAALQQVWPVDPDARTDYLTRRLGLFDPALLLQARKRVSNAKDVWSAVAGGDMGRLAGLGEAFALLGDSVQRLFPGGDELSQILQTTAAQTAQANRQPAPELAMEVATAVLYLDAVLEDGELDQPVLGERVSRLAQRIQEVRAGGEPHPLEHWMEELYRRISDRQTMGSVVHELRSSLSEVEKQIDQYFRDPTQRSMLIPVPAQLSSMRGVLSVLGMDQASQAVLHMRDDVDALAQTEVDPQRAVQAGTFDRLADNLGALSFLIDMLSVQPQLAKTLFRFDPATGSLSAVMGQSERVSAFAAFEATEVEDIPTTIMVSPPSSDEPPIDRLSLDIPAETPHPRTIAVAPPAAAARPVAAPTPTTSSGLEDDVEMREIFLEEAREVVAQARASLKRLSQSAEDVAELTAVRRAFHTLKGSSRMVGLKDFGEAAWSCEQLYNARLAQNARMDSPLHDFSDEALDYMADWVEAIAAGQSLGHQHQAVSAAADALRLDGRRMPIAPLPGSADALGELSAPPSVDPAPVPDAALADLPDLVLDAGGLPAAANDGPDLDLGELAGLDLPALDTTSEAVATLVARVPDLPSAADLELPALDAVEVPGPASTEAPDFELDLGSLDPTAPVATPDVVAFDLDLAMEATAGTGETSVPALSSETGADGGGEPPLETAPPAAQSEEVSWSDADFDLAFDLPSAPPGSLAEGSPADSPDAGLAVAAAQDAAAQDAASGALDLSFDAPPEAVSVSTGSNGSSGSSVAVSETLTEGFTADAIESPDLIDLGESGPSTAAPDHPGLPASSELPPPGIEIPLLELPTLELPTLDVALEPEAADLDLSLDNPAAASSDLSLDLDTPASADEGFGQASPEASQDFTSAAEGAVNLAGDGAADPASGPAPAFAAAPVAPSVDEDDSVKVVGDLRIAIPLFNIFLNEADEQSRRLATELAEWSLEPHRPMGDAAIALAHSLAGNSGTVGFTDLSLLSRALEHALMRSRAVGHASDGETELFTDAADEIRRLLHQFAAGFLKPVQPELMLRLADHEIATSNPERDTESPELDEDELAALDDRLHEPPPPPPAVAAAAAELSEDEQDLDAVDAIDGDLFPIFEEEADELLPQLRGRLAEWARHPADLSAASACMRTLHTFKGGARLAGAMRVGELAHRLETEIEQLSARDSITTAEVERLLTKADTMASVFERVRKPAPAVPASVVTPPAVPAPTLADVAEPLSLADAGLDLAFEPLPAANDTAVDGNAVASTVAPPADVEPGTEATLPLPADALPSAIGAGQAASPLAFRPIDWAAFAATESSGVTAVAAPDAASSGVAATVRVRAPLLDRLVNQAGEVSITRARIESVMHTLQGSLEDLTENLDKLRRHLRDIELQAETQISSRMEAAKASLQGFDPLEMDRFTRFQELTRMMAESVNDVATVQRGLQRALQSSEDELALQARLTRELQDDLLRTRMVEFESLADRLYRVVRLAAKETGKQVRLDIVGGSIEVDRGVLERMVGPFEHLLRNSVAHGIEAPAARQSSGKAEVGSITITTHQEGNEVAVEVRDDGAGLDLARIRARAIERGLLAWDAQTSDADLAQMIFVPGFSTADAVSGLAGRGVGMDVVRAEVNAMGGRIETFSEPGRGTSFRLVLPLTTAVTQVVMLRFGEREVAVPSTLVEVVKRVKTDEVDRAYATGQYLLGDSTMPFFWLGALLQAEGRGGAAGERSQTVVVLRSASQRVAVHVDEVVGNQEVVVKNLGPALSRMPGLAGITLLPSGAVAMIYNPVALATVYGDQARARMRSLPLVSAPVVDAAPPVRLSPMVMVVDDSLTVRRVTQRLLVREGYRVVLAKDGMDALEQLAGERPAVLLSDIEMPRMDGFDLVRNVRADPRLADLPVIMITSRIAQKHRDYAAELGVDHYLGKPYSEDELLGLVARHVGADIAL